MAAVEGAGNPAALKISVEFGLVRAHVTGGSGLTTAASVEAALERLAPDAPAEYVHHAALVIEGILGIGSES